MSAIQILKYDSIIKKKLTFFKNFFSQAVLFSDSAIWNVGRLIVAALVGKGTSAPMKEKWDVETILWTKNQGVVFGDLTHEKSRVIYGPIRVGMAEVANKNGVWRFWLKFCFWGEKGTFIWGERTQTVANTWNHLCVVSQPPPPVQACQSERRSAV